ncbi:hypothetical protein [Microcystis aeruginosa]|uniref:Uncharacterized protein n=1 Tax=Microcystis aeruginosa FD4 TaxID=2686288 RepID=A0A857D2R9_MICAE|nr:hypothetical protein [Microcystis aeruginosa]QGZ89984.1 hypothetical protein GQR42_10800 [Microcystis aeruginosa FD4]
MAVSLDGFLHLVCQAPLPSMLPRSSIIVSLAIKLKNGIRRSPFGGG